MNHNESHSKQKRLLKGALYMLGGLTLLLYTLGVFQRFFTLFMIIGSLLLITYGAFLADLPHELKKLMKK